MSTAGHHSACVPTEPFNVAAPPEAPPARLCRPCPAHRRLLAVSHPNLDHRAVCRGGRRAVDRQPTTQFLLRPTGGAERICLPAASVLPPLRPHRPRARTNCQWRSAARSRSPFTYTPVALGCPTRIPTLGGKSMALSVPIRATARQSCALGFPDAVAFTVRRTRARRNLFTQALPLAWKRIPSTCTT